MKTVEITLEGYIKYSTTKTVKISDKEYDELVKTNKSNNCYDLFQNRNKDSETFKILEIKDLNPKEKKESKNKYPIVINFNLEVLNNVMVYKYETFTGVATLTCELNNKMFKKLEELKNNNDDFSDIEEDVLFQIKEILDENPENESFPTSWEEFAEYVRKNGDVETESTTYKYQEIDCNEYFQLSYDVE